MGIADDLERIAALHRDGALSDEEYAAAKAQVVRPESAKTPSGSEHLEWYDVDDEEDGWYLVLPNNRDGLMFMAPYDLEISEEWEGASEFAGPFETRSEAEAEYYRLVAAYEAKKKADAPRELSSGTKWAIGIGIVLALAWGIYNYSITRTRDQCIFSSDSAAEVGECFDTADQAYFFWPEFLRSDPKPP